MSASGDDPGRLGGGQDDPERPVVTASEQGERVGNLLITSEDVQKRVLEETVTAAKNGAITESGRTICAQGMDEVLPPHNRFPKAVRLSSCPVGATGTIHSHTSHEQLRHPEHSLPDMADTLFFEGMASSMVVGVTESDVMMEPEDQEEAERIFNDVIGFNATGPQDVIAALETGGIPDPPAARREIRDRLGQLFRRVETPFPEIEMEIQGQAIPALSTTAFAALAHPAHDGNHSQKFRQKCSRCATGLRQTAGASNISVREIAIGQVIGTIAGALTNRVLFGG